MGLFKKVRDILFDEEEYTAPLKITPEMRNEEIPLKEVVEEPKQVSEVVAPKPETPVMVNEEVSERELFKNDSFPFLDFDEEEFDNQIPKKVETPAPVVEKRNSNVFEYERKRKVEKRTDYGRYEKTEITETIERKKFKPSPIISPVYGILNQDYNKNDILKRKDSDKVDIQSVRDKAFGESKTSKTVFEPKTTFYEETETVTITEPEEKIKKVKTIDELLEDTPDLVVDIDHDLESDIDFMDADIPSFEEETVEQDQMSVKDSEVDDTLENDLFDLIDSMYDNKEDGE